MASLLYLSGTKSFVESSVESFVLATLAWGSNQRFVQRRFWSHKIKIAILAAATFAALC